TVLQQGADQEACEKDVYSEEDAIQGLSLLSCKGAVLAVGRDMPKAVILRDMGTEVQKSVVERRLAEVLALRDWISCFSSG
ncbi:hypothetical protein R0J93_27560, partial [Pseudoalteromonas sp. SIMBA_148]